MDSTVSTNELQPGGSLLWYRIDRLLGCGSFSVNYLATDTNLDRPTTIKEYFPRDIAIRDDDGHINPITEEHSDMYRWGLDRFIADASTLAKLNHPNIVRVLSVFQKNSTAYMVMEFEEGVELLTYLRKRLRASEQELKSLILPVVQGLAEVHHLSIIHRDIKPENILLRKNGTPVLLNFGSARTNSRLALQSQTLSSSADYAAPEQFNLDSSEQLGPWTDIYALGGVLYFAISGKDPIDSRRRIEALSSIGRDPLMPATVIGKDKYSESFLNAVDWALQLQIADRPKAASDWITAVQSDKVWSDDWADDAFGWPLDEKTRLGDGDTWSVPDLDSTGQRFENEVNTEASAKTSSSNKSLTTSHRIIGLPIFSIVTIVLLVVTIVAAIVTSD